jgi:hypothetical protein
MIAETLLAKLNEWEAADLGRRELTVALPESPWTVHLTADRADSLSCLLWEVVLTSSEAVDGSLKARAEALAKLPGLTEPLKLIEFDDARQVALLRSESPTKRSSTLAYYELEMTAGRRTLRRYRASPDQPRRDQIAFPLTNDALATWIDGAARV